MNELPEENLFASPESSHRVDPHANLSEEEKERLKFAPVEGRFILIGISQMIMGLAVTIFQLFDMAQVHVSWHSLIFFMLSIGYTIGGYFIFHYKPIGRIITLVVAFLFLIYGIANLNRIDDFFCIFFPSVLMTASLLTPTAFKIGTAEHRKLIAKTPNVKANIKEALAILVLLSFIPIATLILLLAICIMLAF